VGAGGGAEGPPCSPLCGCVCVCEGIVLSCAIGLVRYRDCARFTLCAIGTCAIGLVRYRELCQFFVCYRVGALSHRALTGPSRCVHLGAKQDVHRIAGLKFGIGELESA